MLSTCLNFHKSSKCGLVVYLLWFHRLHNIVGASTNDDRILKIWSFCSLWHLSIYTSAFLILCSTTKAPWPSEEEATVFQEPSDMENLPMLRHTVELDEFATDNDMSWSSSSDCSSKKPSCVEHKLERMTSKRQLIFGSLWNICHEILSNYVSGAKAQGLLSDHLFPWGAAALFW